MSGRSVVAKGDRREKATVRAVTSLKVPLIGPLIVVPLVLILAGCSYNFARGARMAGGDPEAGRKKLAMRSCVSCHVIPGVPHGEGKSAPSLAHWYWRRTFLDGAYTNTPENVEKWLEQPSHRKPGTHMPDIALTAQDSRDMTAYLFSIN